MTDKKCRQRDAVGINLIHGLVSHQMSEAHSRLPASGLRVAAPAATPPPTSESRDCEVLVVVQVRGEPPPTSDFLAPL